MGRMKEAAITIEEFLMAGIYPSEIEKRTGYDINLIMQVEEDLYASNEPRNNGADYDQE
jgi:hypothetical protein